MMKEHSVLHPLWCQFLMITHVFACINICGDLWIKHLPRDLASVNAMKQTCVTSLFLYILPDSNQEPTENTTKTLKYYFYAPKGTLQGI